MSEHEFSLHMKLAERVGAFRGNVAAAIAYLEGVDDWWAQQALRTLTAAYKDDTRRAA